MPSTILALMVPEPEAARLPMRASGYPPHITLAFLGEDVDMAKAARVSRRIAAMAAPVEGKVTGLGRFQGTEKGDAVYASFSAHNLNGFREALVQALEKAGFSVSRKFAFTPHITMVYVNPGEDMPVNEINPFHIRFSAITLMQGEERHDFPFLGEQPVIGVRLHKAHIVGQLICPFPMCGERFIVTEGRLDKSLAGHIEEHL